MLKLRFGGGRILTHFGTPSADFFLGKWPKMHISPTTGCFQSNSFAMMFIYYKSTKTQKIMWFGAVADLVWTSDSEKYAGTIHASIIMPLTSDTCMIHNRHIHVPCDMNQWPLHLHLTICQSWRSHGNWWWCSHPVKRQSKWGRGWHPVVVVMVVVFWDEMTALPSCQWCEAHIRLRCDAHKCQWCEAHKCQWCEAHIRLRCEAHKCQWCEAHKSWTVKPSDDKLWIDQSHMTGLFWSMMSTVCSKKYGQQNPD